jgi:4-hydroxybenzoate polyprenyltransferase
MNSLKSYLKLMRPSQWIKNGFVLMPIVFVGHLFHFEESVKVAALLLAFCFASSATYIINDYMDMEQDRRHPLKKYRPLASGEASPKGAFTLTAVLIMAAFALLAVVRASPMCYLFLAAYLVLQLLYSVKLKNIVMVDVITISMGFLLRVLAGGWIIEVTVSSWLILCTFSVAIFLALGKRRHEMLILSADASGHRPVLEQYSIGLLDQLVQIVTTSTLIFYCLYSVIGMGVQSEKMMFTIPLVTYGIFRYLYLIYGKEEGGSPAALLLTDPPLLACVALWLGACVGILYF